MDTFQAWLAETAGNPWLQSALLFAGTFVLEEAALLTGGLLAAAGELPAAYALGALLAGMVVSDWCLYGVGHLAGRIGWLRGRLGQRTLERGRRYLDGNLAVALVAARLVPWLLFPIFVSCGFVGIGFKRFLAINLVIATIYTTGLFVAVMLLGQVVFDYLDTWGWLLFGAIILTVALVHYFLARR